MGEIFDSIRRRLSFSPSPSRTSTPTPSIRRRETSLSRLSKQEIDEILDSPYETNYTYSESAAYKPHIGSREYIHPRLCRRFPATPSPTPQHNGNQFLHYGSSFWEWCRSLNLAKTLVYALQLILVFMLTAMQFTFKQIPIFLFRVGRFFTIRLVQYVLLSPILAPYYMVRSYWYQARFVWEASHSFWSFLRWTWYWWSGQKIHEEVSVGVQTRSMAKSGSVNVERKATLVQDFTTRNYAVWLLLYLPLLLLLLWAGHRLYWPNQSIKQENSKASFIKEPHQIMHTPDQKLNSTLLKNRDEIPKIKPSEQLPTHLAQPIGGPPLNVQKEIELTHQLQHEHYLLNNTFTAFYTSTINTFFDIWQSSREFMFGIPQVIDWLGVVKQFFLYPLYAIRDGIYWCSINVKNWFNFTVQFVLEKITDCFSLLSQFVRQSILKIIDGLLVIKEFFLYLLYATRGGIYWCSINVKNWFNFTVQFVLEKITGCFSLLSQFIRQLILKTTSIISAFFQNAYSLLLTMYTKTTETIVGIWRSAKEFQYPPLATKNFQQENLLSRTPELGELPNDHPLMQRLRQIILQALVEERHFVDQRIRKWVEHNVLVMKSQLQRLEPKIVEETKEKVEAEIFPPPPPSDEEFRDELRAEWKGKMREILHQQQTTQEYKMQAMEQQLDDKIREFVANLNTQIRGKHAEFVKELQEVKRQQNKLEARSVKKKDLDVVRQQSGEPLIRQEKFVEKAPNGKELTRETTVLLNHIQRKMEEFDEQTLLDKVRKLIKQELRKYDADRTGMPDYALESSGGSVLSTRCTVQYNERSRIQKLFGIPLWYSSYSPRSVIQRKGYGASAGECWAYHGGHGFLTIGLSKRINVTAVSYEHLPVELSLDGHIRTAPRNFLVWSYQDVDGADTRMLLGNFTYDANGEPLQIFPVQQWEPQLTQIVELETLTNCGAPVTCLYRFRVHGDMQKIIPEVEDDGLEAKITSNV